MAAFTDWELLRLHYKHVEDKELFIEGAKLEHYSR
jgi:hypothetical protein